MNIIAYVMGLIVMVIMFFSIVIGLGNKADNEIEKILDRSDKQNEESL